MNSTTLTLSLVAATLVAGTSTVAAQQVVSLVANKDTTLFEDAAGALANGGGNSVFIGRVGLTGNFGIRRTLMQFDVAGSIPAGSRILAVSLDMFAAQSSAFLAVNTDVHRVSQDWSEGTVVAPGQGGAGGPSQAGESTWLHTDYPNSFWTTPGGDFDPTPSYSFGLPGIGPVFTDPEPGIINDVQDWLDNPSTNYGWLMKTAEVLTTNARRLNSREASGLQPKIQITYLAPGETGTYGTGWPVGSGTFELDVVGTANGGAVLPITYTNGPVSSIGANFFSLDLDAIGTPLLPASLVYLPLSQPIIDGGGAFLTSATGDGGLTFTVPVGFPGFLIVVQAAVLDATPFGFSLSNAGVMLTQ